MKGTAKTNWAVMVALAIAAMIIPVVTSEATVILVSEILVLAVFATSINLLLGYAGMIPFGHGAFYGAGAYCCAILLKKVGLPLGPALILSPILTAVIGMIVGLFCIRLVGLRFAMLSLAFGQIVWAVIYKWYSFTGGDDGIIDIPLPSFVYNTTICYYFIAALVAVALFILWTIVNSPFGWTLEAIRENTQRVYAIGSNAKGLQLLAFVISSFFAGLAGALYVLISHNAFPEYAFWTKGGEGIIMVVLGGMFSFLGPMVGAFVMVFLNTFILGKTEYWPFFLGTILLVIMMFAPQGITGMFKRSE
jgi:branched-chain amino acid transport system permease protein